MLHTTEDLHVHIDPAAITMGAAGIQINIDNAGMTTEGGNNATPSWELPIQNDSRVLPPRAVWILSDDTRVDVTPDATDPSRTNVTQSAYLGKQHFEDQAAALEQALEVGSQQQRFGYVERADGSTCHGTTHIAESFIHVRGQHPQATFPEQRDHYALDDNRREPQLSRSNADDQQENEERKQALEYG